MEFADELEVNLVLAPIMYSDRSKNLSEANFENICSILLNSEDTGGFRLKDRFTFVRLLT